MSATRRVVGAAVGAALWCAAVAGAQDWPQWRGPNRDAKVVGFEPPSAWPKELPEKWKVTVGDGVATPALVGDKLFVFARQGGDEVVRCLNAADGKEVWQDKYAARGADGPASGFPGPRCSPAVADGKVVTLGVRGDLNCYAAADGKKLWSKDDYKGKVPGFCTSSSPLIVDGLAVVQQGSDRDGGIVAYDLTSGAEKWKWTGDGTAYASPAAMTVGGTKLVVAQTSSKMVALTADGGKVAWETAFPRAGMRSYNALSPVVDGSTLIYGGNDRGFKAVQLAKVGDKIEGKELWSSTDKSAIYNSPVLKDGYLYGISQQGDLFCMSATDGKKTWEARTAPAGGAPAAGKPGGGKPGGGRGMMGGGAGYGSVVDCGAVLLALTPRSELIVFQPGEKEYKEIAKIKIAESPTYAYPVVSGGRLFVKDKDAVALKTLR